MKKIRDKLRTLPKFSIMKSKDMKKLNKIGMIAFEIARTKISW
ncbi:MAG: hypothetical protein ABIB47_05995 [Candidatus Woesearchaeota archaeon]